MRGHDYDARWKQLEAAGHSIHGEADFVCRYEPDTVLDAGCGTGRVAIELARRGIDVVGVDLDRPMLDAAQSKAPDITWVLADLLDVDLARRFDVVAMPGNVMIFVHPGTEADVVANMARHVADHGVLIAGFKAAHERLTDHQYSFDAYDEHCAAAGLTLEARYSTWQGDAFEVGGDYAVSVHRRP
jgi:SAM-dependent methyltransferase